MGNVVATLRKHTHPALSDYLSSLTFKTSGLIGTVCWILSSVLSSTPIQIIAAGIYVVPAATYYIYYRPFGITLSYTPTVEKDGKRTADKVAEKRGEAYLRNQECTIALLVDVSEYRNSFELEFQTPKEIHAEFRDIPRKEHSFSYDPLALTGANITTRRFQIILEIFLDGDATAPTNEYPLKIVDKLSKRNLLEINLVAQ